MKAAAIKLAVEPPHTLTLGPRSFSTRWKDRPTGPLRMGMRVASADERLLIATEATARADLLLPGRSHEDPKWRATYDVAWVHYLFGHVLCSPKDVNAPFWGSGFGAAFPGEQDGTIMLGEKEPGEPGDAAVVSLRFTDDGIARLWDEYSALEIRLSEVWPEISAEDVKKLGARFVDGSFFAGLDEAAKTGNVEAQLVAQQLRRLLSHVVDLRTNGLRGR